MYYHNPYFYPNHLQGQVNHYYGQPLTPYYPQVAAPDGNRAPLQLIDYGPQPFVININQATLQNKTFRTALWTGNHLQLTLVSLNPGEEIGLEVHPNVDQFLRLEQGQGIVRMGKNKNQLDFVRSVSDDSAIFVPAGTWHNVVNTGRTPLRLYSIYAPPNHPRGTVHQTKADAIAAEAHHHRETYFAENYIR